MGGEGNFGIPSLKFEMNPKKMLSEPELIIVLFSPGSTIKSYSSYLSKITKKLKQSFVAEPSVI